MEHEKNWLFFAGDSFSKRHRRRAVIGNAVLLALLVALAAVQIWLGCGR